MMEPMRAIVVVVIAILLAGCSSPARKSSGPAEVAAPTATFGEETGAIEGLVDDQTQPLGAVSVGLLTTGAQTKTDELGRYAFSDVPPGAHTIQFVSLGHETRTEQVAVQAGALTRHDVSLVELSIPKSGVPFAKTFNGRGFWNCAYGVAALVPSDPCSSLGAASGSPSNRFRFPIEPAENLTGYLFSVRWAKSAIVSSDGPVLARLPFSLTKPPPEYKSWIRGCTKCEWAIDENPLTGMHGVLVNGSPSFVVYVNSMNPVAPVIAKGAAFWDEAIVIHSGSRTEPDSWGGMAINQEFQWSVVLLYNGQNPKPDFEVELWG